MSWRQYLLGFDGRISRLRMWRFYFVAWAIEFGLFVLILLVYSVLLAMGAVGGNAPPSVYPGIAMTSVGAASFLAIYYMYAAVTAKRLHDRNKSAWWILPFLVVPLALIFAPEMLAERTRAAHNHPVELALASTVLAGVALYVWGFVELYCLRGTVGENRFGPDPLNPLISVEETF